MQKIKLAVATILVALASWLIGGSTAPTLGSTSRAQASCNTYVSSNATIGHQLSRTVLAAHPNRAYARVQLLNTETNVLSLSFDEGAVATIGNGLQLSLSQTTSSTSVPFIEFGLNTQFPYNGAVTGITNTSSSTVLVTECIF